MKVFLTGASGFIGAGVARGLLAAGHDVIALVRSPASADRLRRNGIEPFFGDLSAADRLHAGTTLADAVIHAGFPRQAYQHIDRAIVVDQGAVAAFVHALAGTSKRLIYTSGIGVVGDTDGASVTEDSPLHTPPALTWRRELEVTVIEAGGVVIRPAFVYGRAGGDILVTLIRDAAARGAAYYAAPGDNVWPNVHVDDLGRAYALALEHATAGRVFNLAGDEATSSKLKPLRFMRSALLHSPAVAVRIAEEDERAPSELPDLADINPPLDELRTRGIDV